MNVRNWVLKGTAAETSYIDSDVLNEEQQAVRWHKKPTKQPFWANYFCGKDSTCTCRIEGSKSLESDAIFFFRNRFGKILAVHVEFKHRGEPFRLGQPEGYPLRAACFAETYRERSTVNPHDDWTTVILCDRETLSDRRIKNFQRVISHDEARQMILRFPR